MDLIQFAQNELNILMMEAETDEDSTAVEMQTLINQDIIDVVQVFAKQGHSGFSASYVGAAITRLLQYKPISPLTGEDNEWGNADTDSDNLQQNKRCPSVFRNNYNNSTARDISGKIFSDDGGYTWWSGPGSSVAITFPYTVPAFSKQIYLSEDGTRVLTDEEEIKQLLQKYLEEV